MDFKRTYAGKWMKGSGAYVWTANHEEGCFPVGGTDTATELLKRDKLEVSGDHNNQNWEIV
ncbi:MAG: hypothetical protein KAS32_21400 [Candidatus Peribacteraceae bacterium]|nr:hypothetical protein [Candidatus Peribacteraceae bacterium]